MQVTSSTWRGLFASGAALQARATIGGTVYTDISAPVIDRATMSGSLAVGNVVSASLALAVRGAVNLPRSAAVIVEVRLNDGETASEWLPQGTFYISRRARDPVTGLLALECYDALLKANALWVPSAGAWPRTLAAVTAELAALLGVELDSRTVIPTGAAYAMSEPAEGTTIRDALSLVAQAAGGNWIMTPAGRLRLVRLGEAGDTVDVVGVVGGIDVGRAGTITGVRSTVDGVTTLTGDDTGIVVDVALAPVIAVELAEALIGQAWQPFRLDGAVYDPAAELGDAVNAGANGEVASALCSEQAAYGPAFRGSIAAPDPGEVTDEYPYLGSAERTLALAKAAANRAVERYDDNLTQQEIFNRLTDNGAAQGLVLYNGQLYVNASYVNAGRMNVGRIDFNEPESYYDVPNENDPASLLNGQAVVDGWIVNTSGGEYITVFSCGFAIPLRGKTVTVTFAFNGTLSGGENYWTFISDEAQQMGANQDWAMPSGTPPNPYTYSVAVPDDAMSFSIAMECAGVKQIEVSLDSPVTPSESIVYNYEGQRIGEGNTKFRVYRDGTLITQGKSLFDGVARISKLYLNFPLDVNSGGTGATNAADARTNLEITPANIGAAAADTHRYKFYTSPNQLGLSGDKTVLEIFNALPSDSVIVTASQLNAADMPGSSTNGELMIWRLYASRTHIVFYGKSPGIGTWRMYLGASSYNGNDNNAPDGVWHRVYDGSAVVPASAGGTGGIGLVTISAKVNIPSVDAGRATELSFSNPDSSKYKLLCISGWNLPNAFFPCVCGAHSNGATALTRMDVRNVSSSAQSGTAVIQWLAVQLN